MPSVIVRIPSLLAEVGDGRKAIAVEAATVGGALEALFGVLPQLRVHVFDETGGVRPHVSVFHEGRAARDRERLDAPLSDGSVVTILQAVSGGSAAAVHQLTVDNRRRLAGFGWRPSVEGSSLG